MRYIDFESLHVCGPDGLPAEQIGHVADGRPLYRAVPTGEPTTPFGLSVSGNWIDARPESVPAPCDGDPRAEVPFPAPEAAPGDAPPDADAADGPPVDETAPAADPEAASDAAAPAADPT